MRPNFNPLAIFSLLVDVWCVNFLQQLQQSRFLICSNILTLSVKMESTSNCSCFLLVGKFRWKFLRFLHKTYNMMTNEQRRTNKKDCSDRLLWCVKMKMVLSEDNLLLLETVHNVLKVIGGFARRLRLSLVSLCLRNLR